MYIRRERYMGEGRLHGYGNWHFKGRQKGELSQIRHGGVGSSMLGAGQARGEVLVSLCCWLSVVKD